MVNKLSSHRTFDRAFLAKSALVLAGMALIIQFPQEDKTEELLLNCIVAGLLPVLSARFIFREPLASLGLSWGNGKTLRNIGILIGTLAVFSFAFFFLLTSSDIGTSYLNAHRAQMMSLRSNFPLFAISFILSGAVLFFQEIFFRGFLLLSWKRKLCLLSLPVHAFVYGIFFWILSTEKGFSGDPLATFIFVMLWSSGASIIAFASDSVLFSFFFSYAYDIIATVLVMLHS